MKFVIILLLSLFIFLPTTEAVESPEILINIVNTDPDPVRIGENFELRFKVENVGSEPFYNTIVELNVGSPFKVVGETTKNIGTLGSQQSGNEGVIVRYTVNTANNAKEGTYSFDVAYSEGRTQDRAIQTVESIVVEERKEPAYLITSEEGSESNNLVIGVTNTGKNNLSFLSIALQESTEYTVLKSPIAYIGNLESDDFDSVSFNVELIAEEIPNSLTVPIIISFTDEYDNEIVREEQINVPIALIGTNKATTQSNVVTSFISIAVTILIVIFAIFMLTDNLRSKKALFKKLLWSVIILTLIGTPIYYFIARNKA